MSLSIIIPVYNMEKYLKECVDSILNQTYKDYELILVNDGSNDSSKDICDKYAKYNKNIKVIHKENDGLSEARNTGLENATKEYIFFIDSDDFIDDNNAFEKISNRLKITNADVLNFGFKKYYEEKNISKSYFNYNKEMPVKSCDSKESFTFLVENNLYIASAWNKVIRRNILVENDLMFVKGIYSEDIDWCCRLAILANVFDFINEDFYCYRQRKGSISKSLSTKNIVDLKFAITKCYSLIKDIDNELKNNLLSYISYQYGTFLVSQSMVNDYKSIKNYVEDMSEYSFLLKYGQSNKIKVLNIFKQLIGYRGLCKLLRIIYKLK